MTNLPAKSTSRGIQKSHKRRFRSGKITVVNPDVKKQSKPILIPRNRPATMSLERATGEASNFRPKVILKPKKRGINNANDLWEALKKRPDFDIFLGWINQNFDEAKEILFDDFEEEFARAQNVEKALDATMENSNDSLENSWGGADQLRVTKWGDWSKDKTLDMIINDDSTYSIMYDPYNGELFEQDKGFSLNWDKDKWFNIELEAVGFSENTMYEPEKNNPYEIRDSRAMNALRKAGVPFLHVMPGRGYKVDMGDNLFIPAKHKELAQNILRGLKSEK